MAPEPQYNKLTLVQATPAAMGEIAIDANGQLTVHNGATVDSYSPANDIARTTFGNGGSSFATNIHAYNAAYGACWFEKINGVVFMGGLFTNAVATANGSVICTLPATCMPVFDSGQTSCFVGQAVTNSSLAIRFAINAIGQIAYSGPGATTIAVNNNWSMNMSWPTV